MNTQRLKEWIRQIYNISEKLMYEEYKGDDIQKAEDRIEEILLTIIKEAKEGAYD